MLMPERDTLAHPLYLPAFEHDGCGVGFIADLHARSRREVVEHGLDALTRLTHRGASAALGAVDGCGVMTAIPWPLLQKAVGQRLAAGRTRALGMFLVDPAPGQVDAAKRLVERVLGDTHARTVVWRHVPIDASVVLPSQRATTPAILQVIVPLDLPRVLADAALYRARLRIERLARRLRVGLTVVSLSTRTVVYKALVQPKDLETFYPDLADPCFTSSFVLFHQRFSTNTSADWALAQPFRTAAHNGEINTIAGNRLWMRARLADRRSLPRLSGQPISTSGSDSQTLDDVVGLLQYHGYSLAHAVRRLIPPAWESDDDMPADVRAFQEYQSLVSEPWDGPTALVFADGRYVGAALDRNGFRPMRIVTTANGVIAAASEVGVLPSDEHEIIDRSRLGPGEMIMVDLVEGGVKGTPEIAQVLARRRPYQRMVRAALSRLPELGRSPLPPPLHPSDRLAQRQVASGCSLEEIDLILKPMAIEAREAIGSMGDDAPPAVLSSRPRLLSDFFRQRFAQVTNPPVDPHREASVMSLRTLLGASGSYVDELAPRPRRVALASPILSPEQLDEISAVPEFRAVTLSFCFAVDGGPGAFEAALDRLADAACQAVAAGAALLVLTDRDVGIACAALPAILATAAVCHALIARGLRLRASVVVATDEARDPHQLAVLCGYGASAVCPYLGYETVATSIGGDGHGAPARVGRYRIALERGLQTIMSKMGVCTFSGYCGAQLFEVLGLDRQVVDRFFPATPSPIGGATLADLASAVLERHARAFAHEQPALTHTGLHTYRHDGEYHATNPLVVQRLHRARTEEPDAYARFTEHVYQRPPTAIRDLLEFAPRDAVDLADVEPVDGICRRFFASAMSVGALSPEVHRTIATAMNRLGARSNSGEGGEEPERFVRPASGDWDGSRTKQVASARFGVTPAYLRSADELQIKIAQGSKPGEGGQLPAIKVVAHIAALRYAQPGTPLISPPVHHDIYSIEDLAQLIDDLRALHPAARINVKLVASSGVGIIAAGVVKAGADAIQISGHDGGTGASPRGSIKHAGLPWEIGLAEARQVLTRAGLRDRVVLQVDGGLKTGRDIAIAAALGADEYGFGTAALLAVGCVMARQCHLNTCPVGIATQRPDLRARFSGTPDMLIRYLRLVASEVRTILAELGLTRLEDLVGRADLLRPRADTRPGPSLTLESLLAQPSAVASSARSGPIRKDRRNAGGDLAAPPGGEWLETATPAEPFMIIGRIRNTDRTVGAAIAGAIAARCGDRGLRAGSILISVRGSAGQSFGAFTVPGMRLTLVGDANDYLGKGMHGGEIIVFPESLAGAAGEGWGARQVIAGNTALYGATGGRVFVAGAVGERFAVRNSGATAVVEGVGDHACEYMTGGIVVVLGPTGRNFAAGMSGGAVYVYDFAQTLSRRCTGDLVEIHHLEKDDYTLLRELLTEHERLTGSPAAARLRRQTGAWSAFRKVVAARSRMQMSPIRSKIATSLRAARE
jgi:glutamate synthase (ferredoxin)